MKRELMLLRHGKSDWSISVTDKQRPLTKRGQQNAQRIGKWLTEQELIPDLIITSPAERALATTQLTLAAMTSSAHPIVTDARIYEAVITALLAVLQDCPSSAKRVLMVGHNPGLDALLLYLADTPPALTAKGKLMTTAALARLQMPDDWSTLPESCAKLIELIRPTALPA